eukprot:4287-Heterococcus_DN1.PRE.4
MAARAVKGKGKKKALAEAIEVVDNSDDSDFSPPSANEASDEEVVDLVDSAEEDEMRTPKPSATKRKRTPQASPVAKQKAGSSASSASKSKGKGKAKAKPAAAASADGGGADTAVAVKADSNGAQLPPGVDRYCCDLAKSSRSTCRKCEQTITKGLLRVGAVMGEGRWGPMTAWHHLECVAPRCSTGADVEGYDDLPEEHQQALSER